MKSRSALLVLLCLMAVSLSAAPGGTPKAETKVFKSLELQIQSQLLIPPELVHYHRDVVVMTFHVKNDLSIAVDQIEGGTPALRASICHLLKKGTFYVNKPEVGKSYFIKMHFRL